MNLTRVNSEDTLYTVGHNSDGPGDFRDLNDNGSVNRGTDLATGSTSADDTVSLFTSTSTETLTNELFNHSINDFKLVRLPLISSFLSSDVQVYKNVGLLSRGSGGSESDVAVRGSGANAGTSADPGVGPLLSTSSSLLNFFKFNSPFLTINTFDNNTKHEYCKSYYKVLTKNVLCYILIFHNKDYLILFNNELKPYVDFEWHNLKFRILGTTGTTSTFGNGLLKLYLVNKSYNTISDHILILVNNPQLSSPKDLSIKFPPPNQNELLDNVLNNNKSFVSHNLSNTSVLSTTPLATFTDDNSKHKKHFINGYINLFDPLPHVEDPTNPHLSNNGLILLCVLLTLREQEVRKNKGNNKPTYK